MTRIHSRFNQWDRENRGTNYPFEEYATMSNGSNFLVPGTIIDASVYPASGGDSCYLYEVLVQPDFIQLTFGNKAEDRAAVGSFAPQGGDETVRLTSTSTGADAGVLVLDPAKSQAMAGWGVGSHTFLPNQTRLAAGVSWPRGTKGVTSFRTEGSDTSKSGEVWLIGGFGVHLSQRSVTGENGEALTVIRVDAVSDPLYLQEICDNEVKTSLSFGSLTRLTVTDGDSAVTCAPEDGEAAFLLSGQSSILQAVPVLGGLRLQVQGAGNAS